MSDAAQSGAARRPLRAPQVYTRYPHIGAPTGFIQLARHLDPARVVAHEVPVSDGDDDFPVRSEPIRARVRERVRRGGVAWYKLSDLRAESMALGAVLSGRADLVHFLDGEHGPLYLPSLVRRARNALRGAAGARTVATFHQPPELLDDLLNPAVVGALDLVTVVSPTQAEWFGARCPSTRVEVVLHGVDVAHFTPGPHAARREGGLRCVTAGHWLRDWAAVRGTAERLSDVPGIAFDVVTSRDTGLEGLPNVTVHRNVSDDRLLDLYRAADVAFLPLTGSTANNALLEGIACGLPVVSTALPSVRAYLPGGEGVLVEPGAPGAVADSLAGALLALLDDAEARLAMGRRARARAEALAWPAVARQFAALYASLWR